MMIHSRNMIFYPRETTRSYSESVPRIAQFAETSGEIHVSLLAGVAIA